MLDDKEHDYFQGRHFELTDLNKDERRRLRSIVGAVIVAILIFGSLIYAVKAWTAEIPLYVFEQGGTTIRLMPGPCVEPRSKVFLGMVPKYAERAKALKSVWRYGDGSSRLHAGCWIELSVAESGAPEPVLFLIFDDGERIAVLKSEFVTRPGQSGT